jgi:hypothetical protein
MMTSTRTSTHGIAFPTEVRTEWSSIGNTEEQQPNGDPTSSDLTQEERERLAPFTEHMPLEQAEALYQAVLGIACDRGHVALDAVHSMLSAPEAPLGLAPEAYADETSRFNAALYAEDWLAEARNAAGLAHFGCR